MAADDNGAPPRKRFQIGAHLTDQSTQYLVELLSQEFLTRNEQRLVHLAELGSSLLCLREPLFRRDRCRSCQVHLDPILGHPNLDMGIVGLHEFFLEPQHGQHDRIFDIGLVP